MPYQGNIPNIVLRSALKQHETALSVCHLNSCSIYPKISEVRAIIRDTGMHVICVSETWLKNVHTDQMVNIEGFTVVRNDRHTPGVMRGGGVAIYIRAGIANRVLEKSPASSGLEYIFVELINENDVVVVGCVYNPPRCDDWQFFDKTLESLSMKYENIIVIGDFNIDIISANRKSDELQELLSVHNEIIINRTIPTHYKPNTRPSCLDLIITNHPGKILMHNQVAIPSISHHDLIFLKYKMHAKVKDEEKQYYRCYKSINLEALVADASNLPWHGIRNSLDSNDQVQQLNDHITTLFERHVPLKLWKRKELKLKCAQLTKLCVTRDLVHKSWRRHGRQKDWDLFVKLREEAKALEKSEYHKLYSSRFSTTLSTSELWRNINQLGHRDEISAAATLSSEELNVHYSDSNVPVHPVIENVLGRTLTSFTLSNVSEIEVAMAIMGIKSKATGTDGVSPKFIKILLPYILPHITYVFNTILTTSVYPPLWQCSRIVPVPKSKQPATPADFRPISILPFLSKAFERLVQGQLQSHVESKKLLFQNQSGFRKGRGTVTSLLNITEDIRIGMEAGQNSALVLLDFSKAFDSVNHHKLIHKLNTNFDISPSACKLFSSYLSNRSHFVSQGADCSRLGYSAKGVPQGSVLGPLLFSMYINDLPCAVKHSKCHLFADDVQLHITLPCKNPDDAVTLLNRD